MYVVSQLSIYKIVFIIELLTAETLFLSRLQQRKFFVLRVIISIVICFAVAFFFPITQNSYNALFITFMFLGFFALTVLLSKFCFDEPWINLLFCCIAGYTVQHLSYQFYNISTLFLSPNGNMVGGYGSEGFLGIQSFFPNPLIAVVYFFIYGLTYFTCFNLFGKKINRFEELRLNNSALVILVGLIIAIDVVLNAVVVYNVADKSNLTTSIVLGVYNIICCSLAIYIQFELTLRRRLEKELDTVRQLRYQEKGQYDLAKENIELINLKCHDLKHQIGIIGRRGSLSSSDIEEMENIISIYDSTVKTDNKTLDIILTQKSLLCNKNKIRFTCIIDGEKLNFISETDLYSLFGNIVDNAIEAVMKLEESKRVIGLRVKCTGKMLSINMHNYYDEKLHFINGLPETTKANTLYHGYGLKSIRYICDKYNGSMDIKTKNSVFELNILFPLC